MKRKIFYVLLCLLLAISLISICTRIVINHFYDENIPVLAYHVISDNPKSDMEVSTDNFKKQMKYLSTHHFQVLSLDEVMEFKNGNKHFKGRKVAITFDDGSESYYLKALPILKEYGFASTNFIITSRIGQKGYLSEEQVQELKDNKLVNLQSHSYQLHDKNKANSKDYQMYSDDLKQNKKYKFKYYAYPFGITNEEYIKALKDNEIEYAFKYAPSKWLNVHDDNYTLPRVPIYNSTSFIKFVLKLSIKK